MRKIQIYEELGELDSYFDEIASYKPLSAREEKELSERIQKGDEKAVEKLVNANLKFVVNYAKRYRKSGVPFSDLISEGNVGLMKAARKFDASKGVKFITYAVWWVRNSIIDCIEQYNGGVDEVNGLDYVLEGNADECCDYDGTGINETFEEELSDVQSRAASLDELMKTLKKREKMIISLYFGLLDGREKTLDEIGEEMNLTKERVRKIKDKAMVKLKVNALMSDEFETFASLR